jgi:hypothetical protein
MSKQVLGGVTLPMGFAEQVLDLEMRLEEEESLELIQILSQMYRVWGLLCRSAWITTWRPT